jgi:nucleotide-binding universal stress UspA family protein
MGDSIPDDGTGCQSADRTRWRALGGTCNPWIIPIKPNKCQEHTMAAGPVTGDSRIVVGVDGSSHSEQALRWSAQLAAMLGARLDVVTAWEYPPSFGWAAIAPDWNPAKDMEKVATDTVLAVFGDQPPAGLTVEVREGGAAMVLLEASKGAVMLVVGSRGHGGFSGLLLGSVSAGVSEHAYCPVLIIHGDQPPPPPAS